MPSDLNKFNLFDVNKETITDTSVIKLFSTLVNIALTALSTFGFIDSFISSDISILISLARSAAVRRSSKAPATSLFISPACDSCSSISSTLNPLCNKALASIFSLNPASSSHKSIRKRDESSGSSSSSSSSQNDKSVFVPRSL